MDDFTWMRREEVYVSILGWEYITRNPKFKKSTKALISIGEKKWLTEGDRHRFGSMVKVERAIWRFKIWVSQLVLDLGDWKVLLREVMCREEKEKEGDRQEEREKEEICLFFFIIKSGPIWTIYLIWRFHLKVLKWSAFKRSAIELLPCYEYVSALCIKLGYRN